MDVSKELVPPDPDWKERVQSYSGFPIFSEFFKVEPIDLEPGRASAGLTYRRELSFRDGWFQGTVTSALAEIVAVWACATMAQPGNVVMSLEQSVKFVGPAEGERLEAEGLFAAFARIRAPADAVHRQRHC